MNQRGWLICLVGVLVMCLASVYWLVRSSLSQPELIEVPVARSDIRAGTLLANPEQFFETRSYPKSSVGPATIKAMDRLRGKVVAKPILDGEPANPAQLAEAGPTVISAPNRKALTVRVHMDPETDKHVQPTAIVDLVCWKRSPDGELQYSVFAEGVEVLAVCADDLKTLATNSVIALQTLALTPEETERVRAVSPEDEIYLILHERKDATAKAHEKKP
jgi:Flp pilus assembly protein CpaB